MHLIFAICVIVFSVETDIPTSTKTLVETIQMLKKESSSTIQSFHENSGFRKINFDMSLSSGTVKHSKINKLLNFWMTDPIFKKIDDEIMDKVERSMEEFLIDETEKFKTKSVVLRFNNGDGLLFLVTFEFTPIDDIRSEYLRKITFTEFDPAPEYIVKRDTDCDIFSCDVTDTIVELPKKITDGHIQSIFNLHFGFDQSMKLLT